MSRRRRRDAVTWGPTGMPDMRRRAEDDLAIVATSHPEFTEHIAVRDPEVRMYQLMPHGMKLLIPM